VVRPVSVCYNCYIDALSKCGASDAVTLTTQVIRDMTNLSIEWNSPDLLPDIITYTSAMNVIANSQEENRIDLGEKMLEEMKKRGLKPNRYTYNSFVSRTLPLANLLKMDSKLTLYF
jgi:pentatricopeptide repeat protein